MSKIYQVRWLDGETTKANEYANEKAAKVFAKQISKEFGSAMIGEINVAEDGSKDMVKKWKVAGGNIAKPEKHEGPVSEVEIEKTVEETSADVNVNVDAQEKKPKLSMAERLAAKIEADQKKLEAIKNGTYVAPRKLNLGDPNKPKKERAAKVPADKAAAIKEATGCTDEQAAFLALVNMSPKSNRCKSAIPLFDSLNKPIKASEIAAAIVAAGHDPLDVQEINQSCLYIKYQVIVRETDYRLTNKNIGGDYEYVLSYSSYEDAEQQAA